MLRLRLLPTMATKRALRLERRFLLLLLPTVPSAVSDWLPSVRSGVLISPLTLVLFNMLRPAEARTCRLEHRVTRRQQSKHSRPVCSWFRSRAAYCNNRSLVIFWMKAADKRGKCVSSLLKKLSQVSRQDKKKK